MIDFNFLRIRWPKLAAIAADASRLVEVSPTSAIGTMQNFCEWAADIALDFYDIDTPNGTAQPQKLESLKATGRVPAEILAKFHNIMNGGAGTSSSYRSYRMHDDVVEARRLIEDMHEVARWLHREADRAGWSSPSPSTSRGRASRSTLGPTMSAGTGRAPAGGLLAYLEPYMPILMIAGGVILVVGLGVGLAFALKGRSQDTVSKTNPVFSATPMTSGSDSSALPGEPSPSPTPKPEESIYLEELEPSETPKAGFHNKVWTFKEEDSEFAIDTQEYQHGIGLYVPYKSITSSSGAPVQVKYELNGQYSKLKFDLGADANHDYAEKNGKFRLRIYNGDDTEPLYDSKLNGYDFTEKGVTVDVSGVDELRIRLTQTKGTGGSTLNIVLGNAKLIKAGTGDDSDDTGDEGDTDTDPDAEASASPKASASPEADASADPDASASAGNDDTED